MNKRIAEYWKRFVKRVFAAMDFIEAGFRYAPIFLVGLIIGSLIKTHRLYLDNMFLISIAGSIIIYTIETLVRRALSLRDTTITVNIYGPDGGKLHTITIDTKDEDKLDEFNEALEADIAQRASPDLIEFAREKAVRSLKTDARHGNA